MKLLLFVVILLHSVSCLAEDLKATLSAVEAEWALTYYDESKDKQAKVYDRLLDRVESLSSHYPEMAELLFWKAVILATRADHQDAFSALKAVHEARDLLIEAIRLKPDVMGGSAYVTLGTLYYMVPKWPIAFGDDDLAKQMLETALKINPNAIDANYFYGEYLALHNRVNDAAEFFARAAHAPARIDQSYADEQLKMEAMQALDSTQKRKMAGEKGKFFSLFNSASAK